MQILIPDSPRLTPVPAETWAPWLAKRSSKMRLIADYIVFVDDVRYVVPCGYVTDGASIPRALWWLWPPYNTDSMIAAVLHDYMYSHLWREITKDRADLIFYETMLHCGASPLKAKLFYTAVRYGGKGGWQHEARDQRQCRLSPDWHRHRGGLGYPHLHGCHHPAGSVGCGGWGDGRDWRKAPRLNEKKPSQ